MSGPGKEDAAASDIRLMVSRLHIENWKSIERLDLEIREGVNLLVGANSAGKTNILEAVYFLYKSLVEAFQRIPYVSHTPDYWSGLDLIYGKDPSRSVVLGLSIEQYTMAPGTNCKKWMRGELEYRVYLAYEQPRNTLVPVRHEYTLNKDTRLMIDEAGIRVEARGELADRIIRAGMHETLMSAGYRVEAGRDGRALVYSESFGEPVRPVWPLISNFLFTRRLDRGRRVAIVDLFPQLLPVRGFPLPVWAYIKCTKSARGESALESRMPWITIPGRLGFPTIVHTAASLVKIMRRIILLKHPDIGALKRPQRILGEDRLDPRATKLPSVLMTLRSKKGGQLPLLDYALSKGFPGFTVRVDIGPSGDVYLLGEENGLVLPPPNLPDGLIKLVAIAVALESRPSILLIDEIENSMHASLLELVHDLLDGSGVPVLVATHSPVVIDLVKPEKIIIVKRVNGKTVAQRIRNPRKLSEELEEQGITLSDHVIYGLTMPRG